MPPAASSGSTEKATTNATNMTVEDDYTRESVVTSSTVLVSFFESVSLLINGSGNEGTMSYVGLYRGAGVYI